MANVLLLEDDDDIAESIQTILALDGHRSTATANGKEAVLMVARDRWDLMVLDVDVEELSGLAVGRAIRDFAGGLPAIVMSASVGKWQRRAFAGGAVACVAKPFDLFELRALIRTLLERPHPEPTTAVTQLPADDIARVCALPPEELDALPYGVIQVGRGGTILGYNEYEASAAHLRPDRVVGRSFAEIAPCTQVKRFTESVEDGYHDGALDRVLRFVFPCHGALSLVSVRLYYDAERERTWIFVSRRAPTAADRIEARDAAEELCVPSNLPHDM
jgi:photoactive yellow protein